MIFNLQDSLLPPDHSLFKRNLTFYLSLPLKPLNKPTLTSPPELKSKSNYPKTVPLNNTMSSDLMFIIGNLMFVKLLFTKDSWPIKEEKLPCKFSNPKSLTKDLLETELPLLKTWNLLLKLPLLLSNSSEINLPSVLTLKKLITLLISSKTGERLMPLVPNSDLPNGLSVETPLNSDSLSNKILWSKEDPTLMVLYLLTRNSIVPMVCSKPMSTSINSEKSFSLLDIMMKLTFTPLNLTENTILRKLPLLKKLKDKVKFLKKPMYSSRLVSGIDSEWSSICLH